MAGDRERLKGKGQRTRGASRVSQRLLQPTCALWAVGSSWPPSLHICGENSCSLKHGAAEELDEISSAWHLAIPIIVIQSQTFLPLLQEELALEQTPYLAWVERGPFQASGCRELHTLSKCCVGTEMILQEVELAGVVSS